MRHNFCRNLLCPTSGFFQTSANFYRNTATTPLPMGVIFRFQACKWETYYVLLAGAKERGTGPSRKSVNFYQIARYLVPASSSLHHLCRNSPKSRSAHMRFCKKGKAIPLQAWTGPEGSRSLRLPDFKTVGTWRWQGCQPYASATFTPGNIPGTHFCSRLSRPQGHSVAGRIMSMKNSNDTIGNRTCDLPTCSAVPQPTALPRAPCVFVFF